VIFVVGLLAFFGSMLLFLRGLFVAIRQDAS
jgi:hypothetical protein